MGTVLSLSPGSRKAGGAAGAAELPRQAGGGGGKKHAKRRPALLHALTWKRLVAAKKKGAKKVNPKPQAAKPPGLEQLAEEERRRAGQDAERKPVSKPVPIAVPVPTVPENNRENRSGKVVLSPRRVVVQASTGELMRCLSDFLCRRCFKLKELSATEIILWFRNLDRALLVQGWQDQGFITPANLVFVYLLCREAVDEDTASEYELQATFLTCLYLAYSYMGNEISYPAKPFLVESSRDAFWERALTLISKTSTDMLRINADPHFFTQVFQDLKNEGGAREREKERDKEKEKEREREKVNEKDKEKEKEGKERENGKGVEDLDR